MTPENLSARMGMERDLDRDFTPGGDALSELPMQILLGVSGGIDSVSLLHALVQSGRRPIVLHFDHGWRKESGEDAAWVRGLARKYRLRSILGQARLPTKPAGSATQSEATARRSRYLFFARAARASGCFNLVLGHHANDQVETFLLQLFRGAGSAGGMAPKSIHSALGLNLYRPWLGVWRGEIETYARERRLCWRVDSSNADIRFRRNALRLEILPKLEQVFGSALLQNLWRGAEIRREEGDWLTALCETAAEKSALSVRELRSQSLGQQRRTVWQWLARQGVSDLGFSDVEAVRGLITRLRPARINLPKGRFARRRSGAIFVE